MDAIGTYEGRDFPESRNATLDTLDLGKRKHHVPFLLEVDVTEARGYLRRLKESTGEGLSFTGWVVRCLGQAVSEHKHIHAMRQGRRLILFDDVDICVVVERPVARRDNAADTLPMPYVIRQANAKSLRAIHDEIRAAQRETVPDGEVQIGARRNALLTRAFSLMPKFLRYLLVFRRFEKDPFFQKKMAGTVIVTSVGSAARDSGYAWAIPIGFHSLVVALGSIARKPGVVREEIVIREYLCMTILFDHDVTDGAPVARFLQRLKELLEGSYGLEAGQ
jgi:pyruvate/2-oxoglutarate dehydrogenase complex dihydrolipoamide acyltransferase (E2) component